MIFKPKAAQSVAFSTKKQGDDAEILIYESIGESWFGGVSAKSFADELKALGDVKNISVRINSPGGDVFDGVAIYNQLVNHPATVNVVIDGLAASIASVIAMAGDKVSIAENAMMMIHNPWALVIGESRDMTKMAETLDKIRETLVLTYGARSGMETADIVKMMDEETWLTGQEAVDKKLADEVTEAKRVENRFDLSVFKNVPRELKEQPKAEPDVSEMAFYRAKERLVGRCLR
jgi:ATP-dependent Clp protease protease subunit